MAEKRYKEINGVRYEVVPNPDLGSNLLGSGGSLPEVDASDNGKVLTVVAGEWEASPAVTEVTVPTDGSVSQALDAGKIYHFTGTLTALSVTLNPAPAGRLAEYHFDFNSGSPAVPLTVPMTVVMPDNFTTDTNKRYEVDILNNYAAVYDWTVS